MVGISTLADQSQPAGAQGEESVPVATTELWARAGTCLALGVMVLWGCWQWAAELRPVSYLDDSSVHEQMVRVAAPDSMPDTSR